VSHHSVTALTTATRSRVTVAAPEGLDIDPVVTTRHNIVRVPKQEIVAAMEAHGLHVVSMDRPARDDPILFECGAAAGVVAAGALP
jgi:hypothetical protein